MRRFIFLIALLMGLVASVNAQKMASKAKRPDFPLNAPDGCTPGRRVTASCPIRMECFKDKNYKNGGRCDCKYRILCDQATTK